MGMGPLYPLLLLLFVLPLLHGGGATFAPALKEGGGGGPVVGIAFGTTHSSVGVWREGRVEILRSEAGNRYMPSVVTFTQRGVLVGEEAKAAAYLNPKNAVFHVRRLLGRSVKEVREELPLLVNDVVQHEGKLHFRVSLEGRETLVSAEEVAAHVLRQLKKRAEAVLQVDIHDAVIGAPAECPRDQLQAIKRAAGLAGLNVIEFVSESVAAEMALSVYDDSPKTTLSLDIGGSKLDVSVVQASESGHQVLASRSDTNLGGIDFDRNLMEYLLVRFQHTSGLDPRDDKLALQRLQNAVERAKVVLSSVYRTTVVVEDMYQGQTLRETITRAEFEAINEKLFERALEHVEKAVIGSGLMRSQVEEVLLVGGSVRIPRLRQLVSDFFDGRRVHPGLNSEEVEYGIVMRAAAMEKIRQAA